MLVDGKWGAAFFESALRWPRESDSLKGISSSIQDVFECFFFFNSFIIHCFQQLILSRWKKLSFPSFRRKIFQRALPPAEVAFLKGKSYGFLYQEVDDSPCSIKAGCKPTKINTKIRFTSNCNIEEASRPLVILLWARKRNRLSGVIPGENDVQEVFWACSAMILVSYFNDSGLRGAWNT